MTTFTHIVGARPNFMKAGTVISACQDLGLTTTLIHTGQHYDKAMSEIFFNQLELPRPDVNLEIGSGTHGAQTATLLIAIEAALEEQRPSHVVVYGDINSTLAAAIVCSKMMIPVSHVEAGLRSFDRSMPEEVNRVITDALSSLHFVTSLEAVDHLSKEGIAREGIHFVGNPMIDTLLRFQDLLKPEEQRKQYSLPASYGVATLHRPSNVDDPVNALRIVEGLRRAAKLLSIVVPLHPRGKQMLTAAGLYDVANLQVVDPMGYLDFISLMAGSSVVLTDSGGIQEETTILRIPCLTLRENTERPVTVSMGTNRLVGNNPDLIERAVAEALAAPKSSEVPPKWDGRAGLRIGKVLASL